MLPSSHLSVEVSVDQLHLLNPTPYDVLIGSIMDDTVGARAKKKVAKRRLDMIAGNAASYCRSLNNPEQLKLIKEVSQMCANLALIEEDVLAAKDASKQKKKDAAADKEAKRLKAIEDFKKEKETLMPGLVADVSKGVEHFDTLKVPRIKELLKYYYEDSTEGSYKFNKPALLKLLIDCYGNSQQPQQEA